MYIKGSKEQEERTGLVLRTSPGRDWLGLLTLLVRSVVVFFVMTEALSVLNDRSVARAVSVAMGVSVTKLVSAEEDVS